jgi:hypothetical protein
MTDYYIIDKADSALVIKESGTIEIVAPAYESEEDEVPVYTQLLSAIAVLITLGDEELLNCIWDKWKIVSKIEPAFFADKSEVLDLIKEVVPEPNVEKVLGAFCVLAAGWKDYQILNFIKKNGK